MDLKDVPRFSGRLWLEYHFSSGRQKIDEKDGGEWKKENSQPGNKYKWENKEQKLLEDCKERTMLREDKKRGMQK